MNSKFWGIIPIVALVFLFAKIGRNDTWQGFYYPDEGNLLNDIKSPIFRSLEECRDWVDEQVQIHNSSGYGYDYECGKNCKMKGGYTVLVCDETVE